MKKVFFLLLSYTMANSIMASPNQLLSDAVRCPVVQKEDPITNLWLDDPRDYFYAPVSFTPAGLQCWLVKVYNHPEYPLFLPTNHLQFHCFYKFWEEAELDETFGIQSTRFALRKMAEVEFVSAVTLTGTLQIITDVASNFCKKWHAESPRAHAVNTVKNIAYQEFLDHFDDFKQDPDAFLTKLANKICDAVNVDGNATQGSLTDLKMIIVRFVETMLNKALWSTEDDAWQSFNNLGNAIVDLHTKEIITDYDCIDDLITVLIHRFGYFITIAGQELPPAFYEKVKAEITNNPPAWLMTDEMEKEITSKQEKLLRVVTRGEIKSRARERGLIV